MPCLETVKVTQKRYNVGHVSHLTRLFKVKINARKVCATSLTPCSNPACAKEQKTPHHLSIQKTAISSSVGGSTRDKSDERIYMGSLIKPSIFEAIRGAYPNVATLLQHDLEATLQKMNDVQGLDIQRYYSLRKSWPISHRWSMCCAAYRKLCWVSPEFLRLRNTHDLFPKMCSLQSKLSWGLGILGMHVTGCFPALLLMEWELPCAFIRS